MGAYFAKVLGSIDNLKITTHSVNDQKTFTVWEWEVTFKYVKPVEEVAHEEVFRSEMADGRTMYMVGVSLLWWNDKGKIVKKHDYSKTAANWLAIARGYRFTRCYSGLSTTCALINKMSTWGYSSL
jgi:hypothetical protein